MRKITSDAIKNAVDMERKSLQLLYDNMDMAAYEKALELLLGSSLTVTTACGSSGFAAKKFAHSLCCVDCPAKFIAPSEAVHGGLGALQKCNAIVVVSKGGKTDELIPIIDVAKQKGAHIIAVTQKTDSYIALNAEVVLELPGIPESDRYGVMSTTSFAANIAIFDSLMVGIMEEKDYKLEQFGLIHPGGAVGKAINK